jgi:predicted nucleotidyltransferase
MAKTAQELAGIIDQYKSVLATLGIRVERIILYGSYAQGKAGEESDIDLIVISPDFEGKDVRQRLEIMGVASARIMEPVQALGVTTAEIESEEVSFFIKEVLEYGKAA